MQKVDFSVLSDRICAAKDRRTGVRCTRRLKQNLVSTYPKATMCYEHWRQSKGRPSRKRTKQVRDG